MVSPVNLSVAHKTVTGMSLYLVHVLSLVGIQVL